MKHRKIAHDTCYLYGVAIIPPGSQSGLLSNRTVLQVAHRCCAVGVNFAATEVGLITIVTWRQLYHNKQPPVSMRPQRMCKLNSYIIHTYSKGLADQPPKI